MRQRIMERLGVMLILCSAFLALPVLGTVKNEGWATLKSVTWRRSYTVMDRQGACIHGEIVSITEDSVTLRRLEPVGTGQRPRLAAVTVERSNVLRISDGMKLIDVVYSGKSSWADVEALEHIGLDERVLLITQDGAEHTGKIASPTGDGLTIHRLGNTSTMPKGIVREVYYIREKPMDAGTEYAAREVGLINPKLWPYLLHIPPKIRVLLYDSSALQDDAPMTCKDSPPPVGVGSQP